MKVRILAVPYDSARRDWRVGQGPGHLLEHGLEAALRRGGHQIQVESVEVDDTPASWEIRTAFNLNRALAESVGHAIADGTFPLVLAGNCNSAVGTVAGLGADNAGVIWFDAHGDFNTPDTTLSGFLDGMALAIVTGRCWSGLAGRVPGFRPIPERNVLLVGARDLDPAEEEMLARHGVAMVAPSAIRENGARQALGPALEALCERVERVYVHLDLDVLDPEEARVNCFAAPNGLKVDEVSEALQFIGAHCPIGAAALTAYDPSYDATGAARQAAFRLCQAMLEAAHGTLI